MIRLAALVGASAVLAGALGDHALKTRLPSDLLAIWKTAAQYHLVHAVVLLALALRADARCRVPFGLVLAGVCVFSGSLYVLALSGLRALGAVTPVGGLLLVAGWAWLAWSFRTGLGPERS
jgi:uncharacterized membrane protein YgdD (TMEM256/DUF423 family)